ncbi:MAG: histidine kinase dimerization/phospho-acceptor domain-containing protein, partial [Bacillota bacterium]|nr:histidine kinase dimerization/phospho-acceptor domain-containing protein [Bacillota bacterium]
MTPEEENSCLAFLRGEAPPEASLPEEGRHPLYFPLETNDHRFGLLVLPWEGPGPKPVERRLLEAFASQIAVLLERAQLHEAAREAQMEEERDKLREALFHSISRSLRAPLASIQSRLSGLLQEREAFPEGTAQRRELEEALSETQHLNWLVHNLLDMTRLRAGRLHLNVDWHEPRALVEAALEEARPLLKGRAVEVDAAQGLPLL